MDTDRAPAAPVADTRPVDTAQPDARPTRSATRPATVNAAHPDARPEELVADEAFTARTVRAFMRDGRLASIPAREKRRLVIYRYLRDLVFTEDREYEEREVNQRLALFHPDVATIRRGMVDARLVTRAGGRYRRAATD